MRRDVINKSISSSTQWRPGAHILSREMLGVSLGVLIFWEG